MIELLNIDCMEYMATCEDNAFDLAIVDPPYGIGNFQQSDGNYKPVKWNDNIPDESYFKELKRVSKHQIIWGANYYNCFHDKGGAIVWDKLNMHPQMSRCEIASNTMQKRVTYFIYEWHGYVVKRIDPGSFHECQKPVALYKWLLKNYAKPDQRILDTHLGSGSSAIAAHYFGCDFVGCEIDKEYYDAMMKRFKRETSQIAMFEGI